MSLVRGSRVCRIAFEHVGLCPSEESPPGGAVVGARHGEELGMDVLVERVAGLDVGKPIVVVCVRTPGPDGRRVSETRTYRTMSRSLQAMADWLVECG
jgi:hypothetical protein